MDFRIADMHASTGPSAGDVRRAWIGVFGRPSGIKNGNAMTAQMKPGMVNVVEVPDGFAAWLGERHNWIRTAANRLIPEPSDSGKTGLSRLPAAGHCSSSALRQTFIRAKDQT